MKLLIPYLFFATSAIAAESTLSISTTFPGANAVLIASDAVAQSLSVSPSKQPKGGWRTWWACDVGGLDPARPLVLTVKDCSTACGKTPVVSRDGGRTWTHLVAKDPIGAAAVRLAWYVPYTTADAQASISAAVAARPLLLSSEILTTSEGGRPVPMLRGGTRGKPVVWIQARQHAWEGASSWVADGLISWLGTDPAAAELVAKAQIVVIPIMDVDNVEVGLGGKDQKPVDFNRNWHDNPHWAAVRAAQTALKQHVADDGVALMIDLHNPGGRSDELEFWCTAYSQLPTQRKANIDRFLAAVRSSCPAPIPFKGHIHEAVSSPKPVTAGMWVRSITDERTVCGTFEIPIAPMRLETAPPADMRTFGGQLGAAILTFLRSQP